MAALKDVHSLTAELLAFLEDVPDDLDQRDAFLHELNERLNRREQLIPQLKRPLTETDKRLAEELVDMNKTLTERLEAIRFQIGGEIANLKRKKKTGLKYENPYDAPFRDGIFFDEQR